MSESENKKEVPTFSTGVRKPVKEGYLIEIKVYHPSLKFSPVTILASGGTKYGENDSLQLINTSEQHYKILGKSPLKLELKNAGKASPLSTSLLVPYSMIKYGNVELDLELEIQSEQQTTLSTLSEKVWITRLPPVFDPKNPQKKLYEKQY